MGEGIRMLLGGVRGVIVKDGVEIEWKKRFGDDD